MWGTDSFLSSSLSSWLKLHQPLTITIRASFHAVGLSPAWPRLSWGCTFCVTLTSLSFPYPHKLWRWLGTHHLAMLLGLQLASIRSCLVAGTHLSSSFQLGAGREAVPAIFGVSWVYWLQWGKRLHTVKIKLPAAPALALSVGLDFDAAPLSSLERKRRRAVM